MCGITGYWDECGSAYVGVVERMAYALRHRGPDDPGTWVDADAGFVMGFSRLSIVDLLPSGRRVDVPAIDAALDVASSSSWAEGFSNAIAEAMACGTPCVATDVGDVQGMIGDTGVVVPPCDPVALSDGWSKLAGLGPEGRRRRGASARQRIIAFYSLAEAAKQYAKLHRKLALTEPDAVDELGVTK